MDRDVVYDVLIVGGGLAGLTAALHLSKFDIKVLLLEQNQYPNHKVCGEYISNEVIAYLKWLGLDPFSIGAVEITEFEISAQSGQTLRTTLPLGGFGISRYTLDHSLHNLASNQLEVRQECATDISLNARDYFEVETQKGSSYLAKYVLGAFGKRSRLDKRLGRKFIDRKSPWLAVKAHYQYDFPDNLVALHNFEGGYCGLSMVEDQKVNACYLVTYNSFKDCNDINTFQEEVMSRNKHLRHFFNNAKPLFEKPLTISQISFEPKNAVEDHILMVGDSAGLIHPLCGNGMSMAIHGAKIVSELLIDAFRESLERAAVERQYQVSWKRAFGQRLRTGRLIQRLLLNPSTSDIGFRVAQRFPGLVQGVIKRTHGDIISV